jgi:2-polyprenyl-3-methyl-5-hydroxy-6-metoxy-1,4-benzoquinol methylase
MTARLVCPLCSSADTEPWLAAPDRFHGLSTDYHIYRCTQCDLAWLIEWQHGTLSLQDAYSFDYHAAISLAAETSRSRWSNFRQAVLHERTSGTLLDVGCGSGSFLAELVGPLWTLHGIELSETTANKARERTGAQVFSGDVADAIYEPESFDVITCFDVLEHLPDPVGSIQRMRSWLKTDGRLYLFVPNSRSWECQLLGSHWYGLEVPRHLFHYSPRSLRALMTIAGLTEAWLRTPPLTHLERSTGYLVDSAKRCLGLARQPGIVTARPQLSTRITRKICRLTFLPVIARLASTFGAGPGIEAMYIKK